MGAASKGIIQRNYQHNATVYKTPYAQNPFDRVTDEDLEEYKRFVDQKSRGASGEGWGRGVRRSGEGEQGFTDRLGRRHWVGLQIKGMGVSIFSELVGACSMM